MRGERLRAALCPFYEAYEAGTWKRPQRLTLRLNDTLLEAVVLAAGEEQRTVAETLPSHRVPLRNKSGNFAMLAAMRRASSLLSNLTAERRLGRMYAGAVSICHTRFASYATNRQ